MPLHPSTLFMEIKGIISGEEEKEEKEEKEEEKGNEERETRDES